MLQPLRRRARKGTEALLRGNAKLVRRVLAATGRDEAPLPEIVQIESTNICNAKCVFCPRDDMARKQGVMDMELFKKVVDECVELGIEHVRMHNYGEPFVDRQLVDKVRYAKQKGVPQVGMISNGSLITETAARGMIEAGLDAINISVDASGKETFEIAGLTGENVREATVVAKDGKDVKTFTVRVMLLTPKEREFYRHGGILPYVLRQLASKPGPAAAKAAA